MHINNLSRSIVGIQLMGKIAQEKGLSTEMFLEGSLLDPHCLVDDRSDAQTQISVGQELRLIQNVVKHLGHIPNLGLEIGSSYHLTSKGVWGFAVASSLTFRQAAKLADRFYALTEFLASFHLQKEGDYYVLEVSCQHLPPEVRHFVLERDLAAWVNFTREMRPGGLPFMAVELIQQADSDLELYRTLCGGIKPQFGASRNAIFIDKGCMDLKLSQADPSLSKMYAELCRQHIDRRRYKGGMSGKVREIILQNKGEIPGVEFVASRLCMASRSLRRRLSEEGTSYRAVVDEVRQSLAEEMLTLERVKLEDVALRLGYSEPSSFVHAFKRWKGVSPAQFRRTLSMV